MKFWALMILSCLTLISCKSDDDVTDDQVICTTEFVFGLLVQVRDANTGGIVLNDITVTATDGDYSEELTFSFDTFFGAGERPGNYTITVEAEGYLTLISNVIEVGADECHVITERVELEIEPL
ncbi:MAG: hypothetical protein AAFP76_12775 [Bacteroidota bacterium]